MIYDVDFVKPPKDRAILVQIVDDLGCCDHTWHEVSFDDKIGDNDLRVFDYYGRCLGEICYWKELDK